MEVVNGIQIVTIKINPTQWQAIQEGLTGLAYKVAAPVLQELTMQVVGQSQPPAPPRKAVAIQGDDDNATVTLA